MQFSDTPNLPVDPVARLDQVHAEANMRLTAMVADVVVAVRRSSGAQMALEIAKTFSAGVVGPASGTVVGLFAAALVRLAEQKIQTDGLDPISQLPAFDVMLPPAEQARLKVQRYLQGLIELGLDHGLVIMQAEHANGDTEMVLQDLDAAMADDLSSAHVLARSVHFCATHQGYAAAGVQQGTNTIPWVVPDDHAFHS